MHKNELIRKLQTIPGNPRIILSKDGEGNGFSPLDEITLGFYQEHSTWSGDFTDIPEGCVEEPSDLCFWPVN